MVAPFDYKNIFLYSSDSCFNSAITEMTFSSPITADADCIAEHADKKETPSSFASF